MIGTMARSAGVVGILFMFLWPRYFYLNIGGKGVSGFTASAILLFLLSLFLVLYRLDLRHVFVGSVSRSPLIYAVFALWWVWRIVCDAIGETPAESFGLTINDFFYLGSWLITGTVLFANLRFRAYFPVIVAFCGIVATVFGVIELTTHTPVSTLLGFAAFETGDQYALSRISTVITRGEVVRVRSLFQHPLVYGQIMASLTPVALYLFLHSRGVRKPIGLLLAIGIVVSITISNARSPFLVAATAGVVYFGLFYLDLRQGRRLVVLFWTVIGLAIVVPTATGMLVDAASGRTSEEAISSLARDRQLAMGKAALLYRPINGYGDGNADRHAGILGERGLLTIDNYYVTTAVSSGYVGVLIFILLLTCIVLQGIFLCFRLPDTATRGLACIAVATPVALALGLTILSISDALSYIFLLAGCLAAIAGDTGRRATASRGGTRRSGAGERFVPSAPRVRRTFNG